MRSYPRNSPEAAARIIALVLICDGHVCRSEIEALDGLEVERELGLLPGGFSRVVHTLCEDLLMGAHDSGSTFGRVDEDTLVALLGEVSDPRLCRQVLDLATAAAAADSHIADAEELVVATARRCWQLDTIADPAPPSAPAQPVTLAA